MYCVTKPRFRREEKALHSIGSKNREAEYKIDKFLCLRANYPSVLFQVMLSVQRVSSDCALMVIHNKHIRVLFHHSLTHVACCCPQQAGK